MVLAAFIISIIALAVAIMTLPTVCQMIWGRPKIMILFDNIEASDGRFLIARLFNHPIKNKLLRLLGIQRVPAEYMAAKVTIKEKETQRVIYDTVAKINTQAGTEDAQHVSLPASIFSARIGIVEVGDSERKVKVYEEDIILTVGEYCVFVEVIVAHKIIKAQGNFWVDNSPPFACWDYNSLISVFNQNLEIEST